MEQPPRFVTDSNLVSQLKKSLYGLKQAPWDWHAKIENLFLRLAFKQCESDNILYVLHSNTGTLIFTVHVHDLIINCNNNFLILRLKRQFVNSFDMTDLGTLHYFLGLQVLPLYDGFFISHSKYVMDLLLCFNIVHF
jgi:hypothetical protein